MDKIEIGAKALEVLKGISNIHQSTVLREDYLYTKCVESLDDKAAKGEHNIIVNYELPPGEIKLAQNVGINSIDSFLSIMNSFDAGTLSLEPKGTTIVMKDKRKAVTMYTSTVDALPQKQTAGDALFEQGQPIIVMALSDEEIDTINRDLKILNIDSLSLKAVDGGMKLVAENSISSNSTEIDIPEEFVGVAEGDFLFPNSNIFSVIMKGIYKIEVRKCEYKEREILICKMNSSTVDGLSYTMTQTNS